MERVPGMCSRALFRDPHDCLEERLVRYLDVVPVVLESQVHLLLGFVPTRSVIRRLEQDGLVQVQRIKRLFFGKLTKSEAEGSQVWRVLWRGGFAPQSQKTRNFTKRGWHPFFGPLILRALARPGGKYQPGDNILLGTEFATWADSTCWDQRPLHWDEARGGLGAGMLVAEFPGDQEDWVIAIHHESRMATRIARGLLEDLGGMLLTRINGGIKVSLHLVIGFDAQYHHPADLNTQAILRKYRQVFSSNAIASNQDGTQSLSLAKTTMTFGMVAGVSRPASMWKVWPTVRQHRTIKNAMTVKALIDANSQVDLGYDFVERTWNL